MREPLTTRRNPQTALAVQTPAPVQNPMPWPYGGATYWSGYPWGSIPSKYNTGFRHLVRHRRIAPPSLPAPQGCPEGCFYRSDLKCCQGKGGKACQCKGELTMTAQNPFYGYPYWGYYGYPYVYGYPYAYGYPYWGYPYWGWGGYGFRHHRFHGHPHHGVHGGGAHPSSAHLIAGAGGSTPVGGSSSSAVPNSPKPGLRKRMRRWFRKYF